jgi:hypothetical protein
MFSVNKSTGRFIKGSTMSTVSVEKAFTEIQSLVIHLENCLNADPCKTGIKDHYAFLASDSGRSVNELRVEVKESLKLLSSKVVRLMQEIEALRVNQSDNGDEIILRLVEAFKLVASFYDNKNHLMPEDERRDFEHFLDAAEAILKMVNSSSEKDIFDLPLGCEDSYNFEKLLSAAGNRQGSFY